MGKKYLAVLVLVTLIFVVAACSAEDARGKNPADYKYKVEFRRSDRDNLYCYYTDEEPTAGGGQLVIRNYRKHQCNEPGNPVLGIEERIPVSFSTVTQQH